VGEGEGTHVLTRGRVVSDVGKVSEIGVVALFVLAPEHEGRHSYRLVPDSGSRNF
jgi:hypothetical protein